MPISPPTCGGVEPLLGAAGVEVAMWSAALNSGSASTHGTHGNPGSVSLSGPPSSFCFGTAAWINHLRLSNMTGARDEKLKSGMAKSPAAWGGEESCGLTFFADVQSNLMQSKVVVKVAADLPMGSDYAILHMESHMREVLASILDRVVGTFVVPTAVGRFLPVTLSTSPGSSTTAIHIAAATKCSQRVNKDGTRRFGAAVMQALPGVQMAWNPMFQRTATQYGNWSALANSARFRIFQYLGACYRKVHSYFSFTLENQGSIGNDRWHREWSHGEDRGLHRAWTSIDNDRCFVNHVLLAKYDKYLFREAYGVFSNCDVVRDAGLLALGVRQNVETRTQNILSNFIQEIKEDEFGPEMLQYMETGPECDQGRSWVGCQLGPPPLDELKMRIIRLLRHAEGCAANHTSHMP